MANFGFKWLNVVAPYGPHWQEARSAVGAETLLCRATETATLPEAVAGCTLVVGTGTLRRRKAEQPVVRLPNLGLLVRQEMERGGRVGLVFGPEKHGLTREDLSHCDLLVEIPTDALQPSMNLGQAVAVCLYELAARSFAADEAISETASSTTPAATSGRLELLAGVIEQTMLATDYSPVAMREANRHDLRLLLRRLGPTEREVRRILGLFRRILWKLEREGKSSSLWRKL